MLRRLWLGLPLALAAFPNVDVALVPPIKGLTLQDLRDTFSEPRSGGRHDAIDIVASRGTPVRAVTGGTIRKLFLSKPGGMTIYLFDQSSQYCYYYAHLDGYRRGLREGEAVTPGEIIGYVGSTGNANPLVPHLHLAMVELGPGKEWWKGMPLNPYPYLVRAVERSTATTSPPGQVAAAAINLRQTNAAEPAARSSPLPASP